MTIPSARRRLAGWSLATTAAVCLLGGAAALALVSDRPDPVVFLDLAAQPPVAPAIAAVAEAAPEVRDSAAAIPASPEPDTAPRLPAPDTPPDPASAAAPLILPPIDTPVTSDLSVPPPPEPLVKAKPEAREQAKAKPEPDKKVKKTKERKETDLAAAKTPSSSATASSSGSTAKGGDVSPASYAKAVMKKVRATRKTSGAGRGTVVVGFTIAADGSLASVQILQSSGNSKLDDIALDHIRRAAPFPPPPADASPGYSFEFVGK